MQPTLHLAAFVLSLAGSVLAQSITLPANAAGVEGSTANNFPWGYTGSAWPGLRIQAFYDSSNLTSQGINGPILITAIRWRCNGNAAPTGGTYGQATVSMAAAAIDYSAVTTTWEASTQVYSGPVTVDPVPASTPGGWYVTVQLPTFFLYDPTTGADLLIDTDRPLGNWSGGTSATNDIAGAGSMSSRIYGSSQYPAANGITLDHGIVVELCYIGGSFAQFGAGCAGSLGVPGLAASGGSAPRVGTTFIGEVNNIPAGVSVIITGLNNTFSPSFGALPFDGAAAGAPGCFLRVSDDATLLLLGGPTATWSLPIPNDPSFCGVTFFNQALVNSPASNAAGWVISDAFEMVIGS